MPQIQYFTKLDASNPYSAQAQAIIQSELAGKIREEHPIGLFTIGAPGAGKTPLLRKLAHRLNGDLGRLPFAIAASASGSQPLAACDKQDERDFAKHVLYINTGIYREAIARTVLEKEGLKGGVDFNNPAGTDNQRMTAFAKVGREKGEEALKLISQTGGEIARVLLIEGTRIGCHTVLDSTGGGFATASDTVTRPLLEAAKKTGMELHWLRVDVPLDVAVQRVTADLHSGLKAFVQPERIGEDVERSEGAPTEIQNVAKQMDVPVKIVTVDQDFVIKPERCTFPGIEATPPARPGPGNPGAKQMRR